MKNRQHWQRGEVATIITLGTLLVLGVSTLISSVFLSKQNKQTTSTKAALTTRACNADVQSTTGNQNDYCIQCTGNNGPCPNGEGVGIAYQYDGTRWNNTTPFGECNTTCWSGDLSNPEMREGACPQSESCVYSEMKNNQPVCFQGVRKDRSQAAGFNKNCEYNTTCSKQVTCPGGAEVPAVPPAEKPPATPIPLDPACTYGSFDDCRYENSAGECTQCSNTTKYKCASNCGTSFSNPPGGQEPAPDAPTDNTLQVAMQGSINSPPDGDYSKYRVRVIVYGNGIQLNKQDVSTTTVNNDGTYRAETSIPKPSSQNYQCALLVIAASTGAHIWETTSVVCTPLAKLVGDAIRIANFNNVQYPALTASSVGYINGRCYTGELQLDSRVGTRNVTDFCYQGVCVNGICTQPTPSLKPSPKIGYVGNNCSPYNYYGKILYQCYEGECDAQTPEGKCVALRSPTAPAQKTAFERLTKENRIFTQLNCSATPDIEKLCTFTPERVLKDDRLFVKPKGQPFVNELSNAVHLWKENDTLHIVYDQKNFGLSCFAGGTQTVRSTIGPVGFYDCVRDAESLSACMGNIGDYLTSYPFTCFKY